MKINFNGAYDYGIFRSASGIVAMNVEGAALCSRSEVHEEVASAFAAEAIACQKAVEMGSEMRWEDIIVEADSLSIVKKCKQKSRTNRLSEHIHNIKQVTGRFRTVRFTYVPQTANGLAHTIAKEALRRRELSYLVRKVPVYVERALEVDWEREPD
ncbi:hypothetical protein CXB51_001382 [Gossypium anomalum]|uniref:RNase H type-1 domain-containing protein n=1 Tax=Gossypium anomalum TaxID=47600 RepID=A0A8J5Z5T7_9ROSI|nr:hypothetical protein CXB51_001382 [Gossypium anomalum]